MRWPLAAGASETTRSRATRSRRLLSSRPPRGSCGWVHVHMSSRLPEPVLFPVAARCGVRVVHGMAWRVRARRRGPCGGCVSCHCHVWVWRGWCASGAASSALHNSNIIRSSHPLKDSTPHVSIVHYTRTTHQISLPLQDSRVYHLSHTALATISTHIVAEPVLGRRRAAGVMQSFFDTSLRRRRHHASCESLSATNSSERSSTRMSRTAQ